MTPSSLTSANDLPPHVASLVRAADWRGLIQALADGLPANMTSMGEVPLLEHVLFVLEEASLDTTDVVSGPLDLIQAFVDHGLTREPYYQGASNAVSLAVHYGQYEWAQRLLEQGYPPEAAEGSVLHALVQGRLQRAIERGRRVLPVAEASAPPQDMAADNIRLFPSLRPPAQADQAVALEVGQAVIFDDGDTQQARLDALVRVALAAGANLDAVNRYGYPPLYQAIFHYDQADARALVAAGTALDRRPPSMPYRPLEMAVVRGDPPMVADLLVAGAPVGPDPSHEAGAQRMVHPLVLCARMGHDHLVDVIYQAMDPVQRKEWGTRAMHMAASVGSVPVMRALRMAGVPYDAPTQPNGFLPIHQAAGEGREEVLAFLLRRGQSWDSANQAGLTARAMLQANHPELLARFGLEPAGNVTTLLGRKPRKP